MPADPLIQVNAGTPWRPSAATHNALVNAARKVNDQSNHTGGRPGSDAPLQTILIKNQSADNVPQYGVLELSQPVILPADNLGEFKSRVVMTAERSITTTMGRFCITAEPIPSGGIGRAFVSGICPVKIDVTNENHRFAQPYALPTQMLSKTTGPAKIIWKESGIGIKWALIQKSTEPDSGGVGGTGGGGCCCDESKCLRVPGFDSPIVPRYYELDVALLDCVCEQMPGSNKVQLYQVDPDDDTIWESKHDIDAGDVPPLCSPQGCKNIATWEWTDPTCTGECHYYSIDDGLGGYAWQIDSGLSVECVEPCPACEAANFTPLPTGLGQTTTKPCIPVTSGPIWNLVSQSNPTCGCVPDPPDYDGTVDGQTATTECVFGTPTSPDPVPSFWRLTIGTIDYYGCDSTKLEFIIGDVTALVAYLDPNCQFANQRPFCRECVNTFRVKACKPDCPSHPTVICLEPKFPTLPCSSCADLSLGFVVTDFYLAGTDYTSFLLMPHETSPCIWTWTSPPFGHATGLASWVGESSPGVPCAPHDLDSSSYNQLIVNLTLAETSPGSGVYEWQIEATIRGTLTLEVDDPGCNLVAGMQQFGGTPLYSEITTVDPLDCLDDLVIESDWEFGNPPNEIHLHPIDLSTATL